MEIQNDSISVGVGCFPIFLFINRRVESPSRIKTIFGIAASYKKEAPCASKHKGQTLPAYWRNGFCPFGQMKYIQK
jgi:hypothetical protein